MKGENITKKPFGEKNSVRISCLTRKQANMKHRCNNFFSFPTPSWSMILTASQVMIQKLQETVQQCHQQTELIDLPVKQTEAIVSSAQFSKALFLFFLTRTTKRSIIWNTGDGLLLGYQTSNLFFHCLAKKNSVSYYEATGIWLELGILGIIS